MPLSLADQELRNYLRSFTPAEWKHAHDTMVDRRDRVETPLGTVKVLEWSDDLLPIKVLVLGDTPAESRVMDVYPQVPSILRARR